MAPTPELAAFDAWRKTMLRGAAGALPIPDQLAMFDQWRQRMLRGAAGPMTGVMPSETPLGRFDTWRQGMLRGAAGPMPGSPVASPAASPVTVATAPQAAQQAAAAQTPGAGTIMGRANGASAASAPNPFASIASRNAIRYPTVAPSAMSASAAGLVDDAAGALAGRGAAANLANSALPWFRFGAAGADGANAARLVQVGGMKGLSRASGFAMGGLMAGGLIDGLNIRGENSDADRFLSGAARGAGVGAAAGSVVPVLGTGLGAMGGALVGGLINVYGPKKDAVKEFGKEATKQVTALAQIADAYGLDPESRAALMQQYDADVKTLAALGGKKPDKTQIASLVQTYASQIPVVTQQGRAMTDAASYGVGIQNAIGAYMQPYLDNSRAQSTLAADTYQGLADKYAAQPTGAYYGSMAANERSFGAKNAQSWAGAMQLIPTVNALAAAQQQAAAPRAMFQSALGGFGGLGAGMGALPTATR